MTSSESDPGTVRPGGRTARVREAVLREAGNILAEGGYSALDLAAVARRAGVGKTTVYRRWATVPNLVVDLLDDMAGQSSPRVETGSLQGDLREVAELVARNLNHPRQGAIFKSLIAAAACNDYASEALYRFYRIRIEEWAPCVEQAIERGELPDDTDADAVVKAVCAPFYYGLLVSGDPLGQALIESAAEATLAAARAGAYPRVVITEQ